MAENGHIQAIATSAEYPSVVRYINAFRPVAPIYMGADNATHRRQALLPSGFVPVEVKGNPASFVHRMQTYLKAHRYIKSASRTAYVTQGTDGTIQLTIK